MNNTLLRSKLELRVNKLASLDYGNIEPWQQAEAVNKAQSEWVRRQLEGINQEKAGNEASTRRIDDLQQLLVTWTGDFTPQNNNQYWQSTTWPSNYIEWCRIDAQAQDDCKICPPRPLTIFEGNEADVNVYLADTNRRPSYTWATTFSTVMNNTFKIWTDGEFNIVNPLVTFYRVPNTIVFLGTYDPYTNTTSTVDVPCEFPDNITEIIIVEAAAILALDIDDNQKNAQLSQRAEHNT